MKIVKSAYEKINDMLDNELSIIDDALLDLSCDIEYSKLTYFEIMDKIDEIRKMIY